MKAAGLAVLVVVLAAPAHADQDPLTAAKDLYSSASYEEALSALTRLAKDASPETAGQIDQYRAFSLFALGRTAEAEKVTEALIRRNPLAKLGEGDVSPRIEAMFAAVRKRLMPALIRDEYRAARAAMDGGDMNAAEPRLRLVSRMLAEAKATGALDETLSDLSLIVDGFLGLSQATARQQQAAASAKTPAAASIEPQRAPAAAANTAAAIAPAIYSGPATNRMTPPVPINQAIPELPPSVAELVRRSPSRSLVLELTINERGDVQDAAVVEAVQPSYDMIILQAARQWKYRPAVRDGVPVKYRRSVAIAFQQ